MTLSVNRAGANYLVGPKREIERGTFLHVGFCPNLTTMFLNDPLDGCQTDAMSGEFVS